MHFSSIMITELLHNILGIADFPGFVALYLPKHLKRNLCDRFVMNDTLLNSHDVKAIPAVGREGRRGKHSAGKCQSLWIIQPNNNDLLLFFFFI